MDFGNFFFFLNFFPTWSYLTFWPSELLPFTTIYHSFLISIWTIILCFFLTTFQNFLPAQNPHQKKTEVLMEGRAAELTEWRERLRLWIMDGYDFKWWRAYFMESFKEGSWMSLCATCTQLVIIFLFWSYHLGCSFYKIWAEHKIKRLGCSTVGPTQRCAIVSFFILFIYICSQFFLRVQILYLYYFENFLMGPCSTCGSSLMMNLIFFSHMMMSNIML